MPSTLLDNVSCLRCETFTTDYILLVHPFEFHLCLDCFQTIEPNEVSLFRFNHYSNFKNKDKSSLNVEDFNSDQQAVAR